ncbi:hypothetical protein HDU88_003762 [Geranomyces variabilis]|nr:hypothetical protein HDU88_003762 [Geranomyces variabilis]
MSSTDDSDCSDALAAQAQGITDKLTVVNSIGAIVLHILILSLLSDRLIKLKHPPTRNLFYAGVLCNLLNCLWAVVGNFQDWIPWFFTINGTIVYFWIGGLFAAAAEVCLTALTYLRVSPSIVVHFGITWHRVGMALCAVMIPLELVMYWHAAVVFMQTEDYVPNLYDDRLIWASFAYRSTLDVLFCGYSIWIVHNASRGQNANTGASLREDRALMVAYTFRVTLFLLMDAIWAVATTNASTSGDITFAALTLWSVDRSLMPWKIYLLITDVARVRALSEPDSSGSSSSRKYGSVPSAPMTSSRGDTAKTKRGSTFKTVMSTAVAEDAEP